MHFSMKGYHSLGFVCALCASLIIFSCKKEIPVTSITLDQTELLLDEGKTASLTATVEPSEATANAISWTSSATDVVTVNANGTSATIKAVKGGTATVSVSCGGKSASCEVTVVPEGTVDLGIVFKREDGSKYHLFWATTNLNEHGLCAKPEDYGDYYAWADPVPYYQEGHSQDNPCSSWRGDKNGYDWKNYKWCERIESTAQQMITRYYSADINTVFWTDGGHPDEKKEFSDYDYVDDPARATLGGQWRTPSHKEWNTLKANCTLTWTEDYNGTGVAGTIVTSNVKGYTDRSIFLPAAGLRTEQELHQLGLRSCYMSSTRADSTTAFVFNNENGPLGSYPALRYQGYPVRAVWE